MGVGYQNLSVPLPSVLGQRETRTPQSATRPYRFEPGSEVVCRLFLSLGWEAELSVLARNGRPVRVRLDLDAMKEALRGGAIAREFEKLVGRAPYSTELPSLQHVPSRARSLFLKRIYGYETSRKEMPSGTSQHFVKIGVRRNKITL